MRATKDVAGVGRSLRADAWRNRERIVEAARLLFAEQGLDVPLEDVADRAEVGIATLYRRFPTRRELVLAVFEPKLRAYARAAEKALDHPDPWQGFCVYVESVCAMQAEDRGFADVVLMALTASTESDALQARERRATAEIIKRAQDAGQLREDFVLEDLLLLRMAITGVVNATYGAAPHAWRRLVAYLLEAFRAEHTGPLPAPPTPGQVVKSMVRTAQARGICEGRG